MIYLQPSAASLKSDATPGSAVHHSDETEYCGPYRLLRLFTGPASLLYRFRGTLAALLPYTSNAM